MEADDSAMQRRLDELVEFALDLDDDHILHRAASFKELARLSPDRARKLALQILGNPFRKLPSSDPSLVDRWEGFRDDLQALAFQVIHTISPVEAANYVIDHAANAPPYVLWTMIDQSTWDADLLNPRPPEVERAAAVLNEVASRLPDNLSDYHAEKLAEAIEFFRSRWYGAEK